MHLIRKTTYQQFVELSKKKQAVIVSKVIPLSQESITCLRALKDTHSVISLLDFHTDKSDHYSFIGLNPITQIETNEHTTKSPFDFIREARIEAAYSEPDARLIASPVGFIGYHAIRYLESIPSRHESPAQVPELCISFFKTGIYFNYKDQTITVSELVRNIDRTHYDAAMAHLNKIITIINAAKRLPKDTQTGYPDFVAETSADTYCQKVNIAKRYIKKGDIFQVVISRLFKREFNHDPIHLYNKLIHINPSPYQFYLQQNDYTVIGASPEKIIQINDRHITSTPLAGTRAYENNLEDMTEELMNDKKENAEHMMLVDLARNDVGRIAKPGSVKTTKIKYPIILSNLIHLASDVEAELDEKYDALQALTASFPAGTLSGAPKIRAMEIIDELEDSSRDLYGGCLLAIDQKDNLDSCIVIRNAVIKDKTAYVRSGAGIVYDSDPNTEEKETCNKATSVLAAIAACNKEKVE